MQPSWVRPSLIVMAVGFVLATVAVAQSAACGSCVGAAETSEAGVLGASFWPRLFAMVLSFAIPSGVVALICFGPPAVRRSDRTCEMGRGMHVGGTGIADRTNVGLQRD